MALVAAGDEYNKLLWEYVIGSVDFRECNGGRSERTRRPRAAWWAEYIGQSMRMRIKPVPRESSLDQWIEWFRMSAGRRLLQLAEILGQAPNEFFSILTEGLGPAETVVPATVEACERMGAGCCEMPSLDRYAKYEVPQL